MKQPVWVLIFCLIAFCAGASSIQAAQPAPQFPPGLFTDGGTYQISDYKGKVVVLWFFSVKDPDRNKNLPPVFKQMLAYKDKPVVFLGVASLANLNDTAAFIRGTGAGIPSFADAMDVMRRRYGVKIAKYLLDEPEQFRIIGPEGTVVAKEFTDATMTAALEKAHFLFKGDEYDKSLSKVVDLLERGDYVTGAQRLKQFWNPMYSKANNPVNQSAEKLYNALHKLGEDWKADAENPPLDPVRSYILYLRLKNVFSDDALGKDAAANLTKLKADKDALKELNAYNVFLRLNAMMSNANLFNNPLAPTSDLSRIHAFCEQFSKVFPDTNSAKIADQLLHDLPVFKAP